MAIRFGRYETIRTIASDPSATTLRSDDPPEAAEVAAVVADEAAGGPQAVNTTHGGVATPQAGSRRSVWLGLTLGAALLGGLVVYLAMSGSDPEDTGPETTARPVVTGGTDTGPAAEAGATEPTDEDCDGVVNELDAGCSCTPGVLFSCYEGADGTEGEGICHGGQQMCLPDGESATLCFGQVVPLLEECITPDDDDCDGSSNEGCPLWGLRFGASDSGDSAAGVVVLDDGTSVVVGYAHQTMDFGGSSLPAGGGSDVIIGKLDGTGNHVWSGRCGDAGDSWVGGVAADGAGDIYLTGSIEGAIYYAAVYDEPLTDAQILQNVALLLIDDDAPAGGSGD